jgi:hypothetical protein
MISASELLAQSSFRYRQPARGIARRDPVWILVRRRPHSGLVEMFRYEAKWKFP